MKKSIVLLIGIFLLSALTFSFSACNASESTSESNEIQNSQSETVEDSEFYFDSESIQDSQSETVQESQSSSSTEPEKQYRATLDVNGGEPLVQSEFFLDYGDFFVFETPERTGYTFLGWYVGDEKLKGTVWKFTEDKTFVAKWQINQYSFLFEYDAKVGSVSGTEAGNYDYGTEISLTAQPYLGYSFIGWYLGETKVSEESNYVFSLGASDTVLTANYTVREEMQVFDFTSSLTECTVTGIKDQTVTEIVLPEYVTSIAAGAFSGCSQVEKMTIPFVGNRAGVTANDTDQYPFGYIFGTSSYTGGTETKQYYYGSSTTSSTYYIPSSLKSVTVTGGNILYGAFDNCSGLTSVTIGNGVTSIRSEAFYNCSGLTSVTIPDSVTSIGSSAFYNCSGLTSVTIPDSVTSIGSSAFEDCSGLTSVTIGKGVTSIGSSAFYNCSGLAGVYINDLSAWCKIEFSSSYSNPLYYAKNLYINKELLTNLVIPDSVTSIGSDAFYNCSGLTSVTIGNGVTSIGEGAFYDCSGLRGVCISDLSAWCKIQFDSYQSNPLYYAKNLYINKELVTNLVIPDSVTSIGSYAFEYCSGLTSVTIGNGVTSIGYAAFYNCSSLTSISVDENNQSYKSIDGNLYTKDGATLIQYAIGKTATSFVIPDSVTSIGERAFRNCSSLTSVTIPDSVTIIGSYAFYDCSGLTSITFTGTKEQWNKISKGDNWNSYTGAYKIYCTDGTISK